MMKSTTTLNIDGLLKLPTVMAREAYAVCTAGAEATVEDAQRRIEEQVGSGVKYPHLPNRSSAPGQSPVNQFEELLESIQINPEPDLIGIGAEAMAGSDHAAYLELGTSKMKPRPFMAPASEVGAEAVQTRMSEIPSVLESEIGI